MASVLRDVQIQKIVHGVNNAYRCVKVFKILRHAVVMEIFIARWFTLFTKTMLAEPLMLGYNLDWLFRIYCCHLVTHGRLLVDECLCF